MGAGAGRLSFALALAVATLGAGCASTPKIVPAKPAEELYAKAEREMERRRWDLAAEELRALVDTHPYHELTPYAELRLGDMYFLDRRYPEAIAAFEQFLKLRPSHPDAAYAMYLLASAHYHERVTFDRDPTETAKAAEMFARLLREYGGSPYADKARERLAETRSELAEHEFYIGAFYFKQDRYQAALHRFQKISRLYPDQPASDRARLRAGECELRLARPDEARKTLSTLVHGAPGSDLAARAEQLLRDARLEPLPAAAMAPVSEGKPAASRAAVR